MSSEMLDPTPPLSAPKSDEIAYGVQLQGVFDGIAFWVLKDGTRHNRWSGTPRGDVIEPLMHAWTPETTNN